MSIRSTAYQLLACVSLFVVMTLSVNTALAQSSTFTYQGRLTEGTKPADGLYDMQFKLFDTGAVGTGTQQGATITDSSVQVTNAVFSVQLSFDAGVFDGSPRFLEISVRPTGSPDPYTVLAPRQPVTATPYAIRSATATNATQLDGLPATGFILNGALPQPGSFNITGNGTIAGTLSGGLVNAGMGYNINGNRVLSAPGVNNLFAGVGAGFFITAGCCNSFFGHDAGRGITQGNSNSFFGHRAGFSNDTGGANSFYGVAAGSLNTSGHDNAFFGYQAGRNNNASLNSFFGGSAGLGNTTGSENSFFGQGAGQSNTTGPSNSFFGSSAGFSNTTGSANSFFGRQAGRSNTVGIANSFFGLNAGLSNTQGSSNSFFGMIAGQANTTGSNNSFFGQAAGLSNTEGSNNSFFGSAAGFSTTTGIDNSFFGLSSGSANTTGGSNSFFGRSAGQANIGGSRNSFFGMQAGFNNTQGTDNAFFGYNAGLLNTEGNSNSFFGDSAGQGNTTGFGNSFVGQTAGLLTSTGQGNTFVGFNAGEANTTGSNNTAIGADADVASNNLSNATAIGAGATVSTSNTIALGRTGGLDTVRIPGSLIVDGTVSKGGGSFKIDHPLDPENKTLSHSFVESPDMMNIYNGNVVLDRRGEATVTMPDYFQALNRDFRYQLTCIGGFAPVYVAREIKGNSFKIAGGRPGLKVSWQVTGVRQDAYANAHRIPVEEEKPAAERGAYLHPDAFGKQSTKRDRTKQAGGKQR